MSTPFPSADRNLLFGLLALQMDLRLREQLLDAMQAWMLRKRNAQGTVLRERGALGEAEREAVERLVDVHAARHGGAHNSLASVAADLRRQLSELDDPDVQASLASAAPPSPSTDEEGRLTELLLRWEEWRAVGQAPTPEEMCRDCPELLGRFRAAVRDLAGLAPLLVAIPIAPPCPRRRAPGRAAPRPAPRAAFPPAVPARQGRAGRGVRRPGRGAGPRGGLKEIQEQLRRRPRQPGALRARGGDHRQPGAPRHRARLRPGDVTPTAGPTTPCASSRARRLHEAIDALPPGGRGPPRPGRARAGACAGCWAASWRCATRWPTPTARA